MLAAPPPAEDHPRATASAGRRRAPWRVLAAVVLLGGAAAASWTVLGSGTGTARVSSAGPVTLGPATPTATLVPGGTATVALVATNPHPVAQRIGSLALDTTQGTAGLAVDAAHGGCPLGSLAFTTQSNGMTGWTVPGNGSLAISLTGALAMTAGAADACQGARFTVYLKALP